MRARRLRSPALAIAFLLTLPPAFAITLTTTALGDDTTVVPSDPAAGGFGAAVAADLDTIVIGAENDWRTGVASGAVYVYERNAGGPNAWGEVAKVTPLQQITGMRFGAAVAIDRDVLVVGAPAEARNAGAVYVFVREPADPSAWTQVKRITPVDAASDDFFGCSVGVSGDTVIAGAYGDDDDGSESGAAYVFGRHVGGAERWGQVRKLVTSRAEPGARAGWAVAVSGDTAVVGAPRELNSGRAYLFERDHGGASRWGETRRLAQPGLAPFDDFAWSVAIDRDTVVIGARFASNGGPRTGWAHTYARHLNGGNWGSQRLLWADDGAAADFFGTSVAVRGDLAIVGAPSDDDAGSESGAAYVFQRNVGGDTGWGQIAKITAPAGAAGDRVGAAVAITSGAMVLGAPGPASAPVEAAFAHVRFTSESDACPPQPSCFSGFGSGVLRIDETVPGRETIRLKLGQFYASPEALGDPVPHGGTEYRVCLYDDADALAGEVRVAGDDRLCDGVRCWRALDTPDDAPGYVHRGGGIVLKLRSSPPGIRSSLLLLEARNRTGLPPAFEAGIAARLAGSTSVTAQLVRNDSVRCIGQKLSSVRADGGGVFRVKH